MLLPIENGISIPIKRRDLLLVCGWQTCICAPVLFQKFKTRVNDASVGFLLFDNSVLCCQAMCIHSALAFVFA